MIKFSTRIVILFPSFVVKIPIDRRGYLQCKNESKMWKEYKDDNSFCPIYFSFLGIIFMKRIKPITFLNYKNVRDIKDKYEVFNFSDCDLYNPVNWGYHKGKQILLDYGITEEISKMY